MTNILNLNGKKKQPSNKGLINAYVCTELHTTITKNIDEGPNQGGGHNQLLASLKG